MNLSSGKNIKVGLGSSARQFIDRKKKKERLRRNGEATRGCKNQVRRTARNCKVRLLAFFSGLLSASALARNKSSKEMFCTRE